MGEERKKRHLFHHLLQQHWEHPESHFNFTFMSSTLAFTLSTDDTLICAVVGFPVLWIVSVLSYIDASSSSSSFPIPHSTLLSGPFYLHFVSHLHLFMFLFYPSSVSSLYTFVNNTILLNPQKVRCKDGLRVRVLVTKKVPELTCSGCRCHCKGWRYITIPVFVFFTLLWPQTDATHFIRSAQPHHKHTLGRRHTCLTVSVLLLGCFHIPHFVPI